MGPVSASNFSAELILILVRGVKVISIQHVMPGDIWPGRSYRISNKSRISSGRSNTCSAQT
eukprot:26758-Eustigmatos_ZCMA.PRE.1